MVTRWDDCEMPDTGEPLGICPCPDGGFVQFSDYAALLAENELLKAEVRVTEDNLAFAMRSIGEMDSRCSDIPAYRHSPDESGVMRPCSAGEWVSVEDYAGLREFYRNAGYTAADVATAAADGFRDGVRSVDLEQFRDAVEKAMHECVTLGFEDYCRNLLALIDAHKGE